MIAIPIIVPQDNEINPINLNIIKPNGTMIKALVGFLAPAKIIINRMIIDASNPLVESAGVTSLLIRSKK